MDMLTSLLKPPRDNENSSIAADTRISDSSQLSGRVSRA